MTGVNVRALGLATGVLWGALVAVLGVLSRTGWGDQWRDMLADVYVGYDESSSGVLVGAIWGFLDAFVLGVTLGWLYNQFDRRSAREGPAEMTVPITSSRR